MGSKFEPVIWSHDTGQWISCFDRCQLTIKWMSNIKDVRRKLRLHDLQRPRHCHPRHRHRVLAPAIHAASHVDHEKEWHGFLFLYMHVVLFL